MKQRIVTGVLAGAFFIAVTFIGGTIYTALLILLSLIGLFEYSKMNGLKWNSPIHITASLGLLALIFPFGQLGLAWLSPFAVIWLFMFLLLAITVLSKNKYTLDHIALMFIGTVYIGIGFSSMIDVRMIQGNGLLWSFLAFCAIWASDIGAYFFGRAFGKRKLWPLISPNKTIEGAIGGVISSVAIAIVFSLFANDIIELWRAILIGLTAAVAGQLGDLIQSAYKRIRGIKDMGNLLPGHGGVIDRCDSWIIVFPILILTQLIPV